MCRKGNVADRLVGKRQEENKRRREAPFVFLKAGFSSRVVTSQLEHAEELC
jgi:hypothetical protein